MERGFEPAIDMYSSLDVFVHSPFYKKKDTFSNEIIPTLIIKNKSEFDRILKEYMRTLRVKVILMF